MTECVNVCVRRWTVNVCVHIYIYMWVCACLQVARSRPVGQQSGWGFNNRPAGLLDEQKEKPHN